MEEEESEDRLGSGEDGGKTMQVMRMMMVGTTGERVMASQIGMSCLGWYGKLIVGSRRENSVLGPRRRRKDAVMIPPTLWFVRREIPGGFGGIMKSNLKDLQHECPVEDVSDR